MFVLTYHTQQTHPQGNEVRGEYGRCFTVEDIQGAGMFVGAD